MTAIQRTSYLQLQSYRQAMTGALVRDFYKDYRELRYTNQGSISPTSIEKNAYRLSLTLEITHLDAPRYSNLKTLPENTHFGYCTLFRGSTVIETTPVKYPKFRIFDILNSGIWAYHQHTEKMQLLSQLIIDSAMAAGRDVVSSFPEAVAEGFCVVAKFLDVVSDPADPLVYWFFGCEDEDPSLPGARELSSYRGFPVGSPFPDIAKFKADVPCSFLWRLEAWYLVNPAVYIVDSPTDDGDETEGESEFPDPSQGDGDGDGNEFPRPSPKDANRDPRDYGDSNEPPPFEGGQCPGVIYQVNYESGGTVSPPIAVISINLPGPIGGIRIGNTTVNGVSIMTGTLVYGEPSQEMNLGALLFEIESGSPPTTQANNPRFKILNVVRLDGLPDDCGDPSPLE